MLKTTRRGFLGAILAIPLAGWTGFRAVMAPKPLYFPPIVQDHVNYLMNAHMANVKRTIGRDFAIRFERKMLGLEDLDGLPPTSNESAEAAN